MTKHLIIITGPTAIGKTRVAIKTAYFLNTEIVSADSRQIYRELSIGTAVPSAAELNSIKHHFIHSHSIHDNYNASRYETEAMELLEKLFKKYNTVVLTGGSMLYIDAVCKGIDIMPDVDPELRQNLKTKLNDEGIESVRFQLKQLDPEYYKQVDLKNPARIVHALEICLMTGKPYSSFRTSFNKKRPFSVTKIGLDCNRAELHQRINRRVDEMIEAGLEKEARGVYPFKHLNSLNTVGYREFFAHFNGEISKEKAVELIKRNSRRYARKQLTWFRKDAEMNWFHPQDSEKVIEFIQNKIEKI
ncbi:MAG: tRNA (adenosine(37)-N6)-dimethylallyltransferase MiaA [Mariniphaga sp.]|jgi:tRNA dimethylallyltransferase|nr:tRNA (adenosine(37)-N6)-dimethylallyltransferase MiaA [Mariniphaga sp.]